MNVSGDCSLYPEIMIRVNHVYMARVSLLFNRRQVVINFVIWIIVGALIGWIASIIMRTNARQGLIGDILVGIVGAFVGGYFLSPLFHVDTINQGDFSLPALLVSLGGAVILLAISKLFRNVVGCLMIVIIALGVYAYFNCWTMASTSAYCASLKALPFLR